MFLHLIIIMIRSRGCAYVCMISHSDLMVVSMYEPWVWFDFWLRACMKRILQYICLWWDGILCSRSIYTYSAALIWYVYTYIYIYIYIYMYLHIHTHTYIHGCSTYARSGRESWCSVCSSSTHASIYEWVCMCKCIFHVCMYVCMCQWMLQAPPVPPYMSEYACVNE